MKLRLTALALLLAFVGAFVMAPRSTGTVVAKEPELLKNMKVEGTLQGGGWFKGRLTITELRLNNEGTALLASGVLEGLAKPNGSRAVHVSQPFTNQAISLTNADPSAAGFSTQTHETTGRCRLVLLDIPGGLTIDILGLVIVLQPVRLEIFAVAGPGNLLGNLLCAIAHLLDPQQIP